MICICFHQISSHNTLCATNKQSYAYYNYIFQVLWMWHTYQDQDIDLTTVDLKVTRIYRLWLCCMCIMCIFHHVVIGWERDAALPWLAGFSYLGPPLETLTFSVCRLVGGRGAALFSMSNTVSAPQMTQRESGKQACCSLSVNSQVML